MKSKEEILDRLGHFGYNLKSERTYLKSFVLEAMDTYALEQTESLRKELEDMQHEIRTNYTSLAKLRDQLSDSRKEVERLKVDGWIKVEDSPLVIYTKDGHWECTENGNGPFLAAVPTNEGWWIRQCIMEDGIGLTVMGDEDNEPAGWMFSDITHYKLINEPPA